MIEKERGIVFHHELKVLPGIDCAACGSPSCRSLAEDIVQGRAELSW